MNDILFSSIRLSELETLIENCVRKVITEFIKDGQLVNTSHGIQHELDMMNVKEASKFLGIAIPTLYAKVSQRIIPHSKRGKKLYFSKKQLTQWLMEGNRKTVNDLSDDASKYLRRKKL